MSAHTPAPWIHPIRYDPSLGEYVPCGAIETTDGKSIAVTSCCDVPCAEWTANARLIAAAPAMLAKLRSIAATCIECDGDGNLQASEPCAGCADIWQLINEAQGQS